MEISQNFVAFSEYMNFTALQKFFFVRKNLPQLVHESKQKQYLINCAVFNNNILVSSLFSLKMVFKRARKLKRNFLWLGILPKMVFCYQKGSALLWEEIALVIKKNFWNLRLKAENLQNFWDHENNLFQQWKFRTIFGDRMIFKLFPGGFSYLMN